MRVRITFARARFGGGLNGSDAEPRAHALNPKKIVADTRR
jgi:hypothetical protein